MIKFNSKGTPNHFNCHFVLFWEECYNIPTTITIGVPKYKLQILMITY